MAIVKTAKHFMELEIPRISKLKEIYSPEVSIHGIPWKIKVEKLEGANGHHLAVFLCCANKDESPNWSLSGAASFKLLPHGKGGQPIEYNTPSYVFDASGNGYGTADLIEWNDLFNESKKYVKDDKINLEIKVTAENPNDPKRSRLNFNRNQKYCDNSYSATFQLKVANVLNLMAVQSPQFTLRDLPWVIQISKKRSTQLGVVLLLEEDSDEVTCKATMTTKLISSKENAQPIQKRNTQQYQSSRNLNVMEVISWDEMIKPENGYVNNDSISLEVEIKVNDPEDDAPSAKRAKLDTQEETRSVQMECPICLKSIVSQKLAVTTCGHMFCFECIKKAIAGRAACPSCNKTVRLNGLRELYLPVVN